MGHYDQNANFIELAPKPFDDITVARSDILGDACDPDDDNDARSDPDETGGLGCGGAVTNPLDSDTDGDNYLDGPECTLGTNPTLLSSKPASETLCGPAGDADGDGISDRREICFIQHQSSVGEH